MRIVQPCAVFGGRAGEVHALLELHKHLSLRIGYDGGVGRTPSVEMAARAGIEPMVRFLEACAAAISSESAKTADAQLRGQELSSLTKIILTWPKLSGEFRAAVLAMTQSAMK